MLRSTIAAVCLIVAAARAGAQEARPPVDVGVGFGRLFVHEYEDFFTGGPDQSAVDLRVSLPFTPRFAFEGMITVGRRNAAFQHRTEGLYLLQVKQRLRSATGDRFHVFLTYGAAGYYAHVHQTAGQVLLPDGTKFPIPEFSYTETGPPLAAVLGGGVQHELAGRVAIRSEAQLVTVLWLPLGVRLSAGVSIPF
jgi:hypothetical protein